MRSLIDGEFIRWDLIEVKMGILFSSEMRQVVGFLSLYWCCFVVLSVSNLDVIKYYFLYYHYHEIIYRGPNTFHYLFPFLHEIDKWKRKTFGKLPLFFCSLCVDVRDFWSAFGRNHLWTAISYKSSRSFFCLVSLCNSVQK